MENYSEMEGAQQGALLGAAQQVLAEAEQVTAGRLARIVNYEGSRPVCTGLYPARVARYAFRALGTPAPMYEGYRLRFTCQGTTVTVEPNAEGYAAFCLALIAYCNSQIKRRDRVIRRRDKVIRALTEQLRQRGQEGGQQL